MLHLLRRHPVPIRASFDSVLVVAWAFPADVLRPLLPPGLVLDEWQGRGFLAAAFVQTRRLRPAFLPPFLGRSFFLVGYRVFCRFTTRTGRRLRGLKILRTDTDRSLMVRAGNLLTRYGYRLAEVRVARDRESLAIEVDSEDGFGDVRLRAETEAPDERLPDGSPFATAREARRFAGPMPFTFESEPETGSILRIEGRREGWEPRLIPVAVDEMSFLRGPAFAGARPELASCFFVEEVEYRWDRGVLEPLGPA